MTTPYERTRALRQAGEPLERLAKREDVSTDVRKQTLGILPHYPDQWALDTMAQDWQVHAGRHSQATKRLA